MQTAVTIGMLDFDEREVRRLVAGQLGVDVDVLTRDVSLTDELAADSLDLVELALMLEAEFDVVLSDPCFEQVRTYGDLLGALAAAAPVRQRAHGAGWSDSALHVRLVPDAGASLLEQSAAFTPYELESIRDVLWHAPRGSRIEVTLERGTGTEVEERVRALLAPLETRGVELCFGRRTPERRAPDARAS